MLLRNFASSMALDPNARTLAQITLTAVQFLCYGVYMVLFGLCMHILSNRPRASWSNLSFLATILLFILSSTDTAVCVTADILTWCDSCQSRTRDIKRLFYIQFYLKFTSSAVADAILLWRCFAVWGRRWKIVMLPMLLSFGSHTLLVISFVVIFDAIPHILVDSTGIEVHAIQDVAASITGVVVGLNNLLISSLIAFRILSMSREITAYLDSKPKKMYSTVIATTFESGLIYSVFVSIPSIMAAELSWPRSEGHNYIDFFVRSSVISIFSRTWPSVAGIASTIIVVRVALDVSMNDAGSTLASGLPIFRSVDTSSALHDIALVRSSS
ncbi:hypothetical protein WG66_004273 [Moniliophthora roreri]|nr:hypothetical protein WG66_004273 [Moniliophthora roreri]